MSGQNRRKERGSEKREVSARETEESNGWKNQSRRSVDAHRQSPLSPSLCLSPSPPSHVEARQEREHRQQLRMRRPRSWNAEAAAGWPPWRLRLPHLIRSSGSFVFFFLLCSKSKGKREYGNGKKKSLWFHCLLLSLSLSLSWSSRSFALFAVRDALSREALEARRR